MFKQLRTLVRNGVQSSPLFSVTSELFLLPRGVVPSPVTFFVGSELAASALLSFHAVTNCFFFSERPLALRGSFNLTALPLYAGERAIAAVFSRGKNSTISHGAVPIQCFISPFNARKHPSAKGLDAYRQLP